MPRINPTYNFAATHCVQGLAQLPAEKKAHAHRTHMKAQPKRGYSHPPKDSTRSNTARVMADGKYRGKLTISQAEKELIEQLNRL